MKILFQLYLFYCQKFPFFFLKCTSNFSFKFFIIKTQSNNMLFFISLHYYPIHKLKNFLADEFLNVNHWLQLHIAYIII